MIIEKSAETRLEAEKALRCLFIAVDEQVARDVRSKVITAFEDQDARSQLLMDTINRQVKENRILVAALKECFTDENASGMVLPKYAKLRMRAINVIVAGALQKVGAAE
jgi:hypothetical protein